MKLSPLVLLLIAAVLAFTGCTAIDLEKGHYWSMSDNEAVEITHGADHATIASQNNSPIWDAGGRVGQKLIAGATGFNVGSILAKQGITTARAATAALAPTFGTLASNSTGKAATPKPKPSPTPRPKPAAPKL